MSFSVCNSTLDWSKNELKIVFVLRNEAKNPKLCYFGSMKLVNLIAFLIDCSNCLYVRVRSHHTDCLTEANYLETWKISNFELKLSISSRIIYKLSNFSHVNDEITKMNDLCAIKWHLQLNVVELVSIWKKKWSCYLDRNQSITECSISLALSSLTVLYDGFLAHFGGGNILLVWLCVSAKILTTCQCVEQVKSHIRLNERGIGW